MLCDICPVLSEYWYLIINHPSLIIHDTSLVRIFASIGMDGDVKSITRHKLAADTTFALTASVMNARYMSSLFPSCTVPNMYSSDSTDSSSVATVAKSPLESFHA